MRFKPFMLAALIALQLAVSASTMTAGSAVAADTATMDRRAVEMVKHDFKEKGIAKLDRLNQDAVQAACVKYSDKPPHEGPDGLDKLEKEQMTTI